MIIVMRIPIAPEGLPIIKWVLFIWMLSWLTIDAWVIGTFTAIVIFVISFFRDFKRTCPNEASAIYSAADGRIIDVFDVMIDGKPYKQVATFLSIFNCHVNRVPLAGKVIKSNHIPGRFKMALFGDIDKVNEQHHVDIETAIGVVRSVQITGAIARRIICHLKPNDDVGTGDRYGIIRFGSRTDVFLPADKVTVSVSKGDTVRGGLTTIATIS